MSQLSRRLPLRALRRLLHRRLVDSVRPGRGDTRRRTDADGIRRFGLESGNNDVAFAWQMPDGACGFFERDSRLCAIHRDGGSAALPATCRIFPRLVLHDARGTFVSLSHFCPTAAAMLFDAPGPDAIVDAPASLTGEGRLDGLDATDAWPPLLRTSVLMDLDAYAAWEERAVDRVDQ